MIFSEIRFENCWWSSAYGVPSRACQNRLGCRWAQRGHFRFCRSSCGSAGGCKIQLFKNQAPMTIISIYQPNNLVFRSSMWVSFGQLKENSWRNSSEFTQTNLRDPTSHGMNKLILNTYSRICLVGQFWKYRGVVIPPYTWAYTHTNIWAYNHPPL